MNDQLAQKFEVQETEVKLPDEFIQKLQDNPTYKRIKENFNDPKFRGSKMLLPHIIETILLPTFDAFALLPPGSREIKYLTLWIIDGVPDPENEQIKTLPSAEEIAVRLAKMVLNTIDEWKKLEFLEKIKLEPTVIPFVAQNHKEMDIRHGTTEKDPGEIIESKHNVHHMPLREDTEKARRTVIGQISEKIKSESKKLTEQTNPDDEQICKTISGIREKIEHKKDESSAPDNVRNHREDGRYSLIYSQPKTPQTVVNIDDEPTDPNSEDDRPTDPGTPDSLRLKIVGS